MGHRLAINVVVIAGYLTNTLWEVYFMESDRRRISNYTDVTDSSQSVISNHQKTVFVDDVLDLSELAQLETLRGGRTLLYFGEDQVPFPKPIEDADIIILYQCLYQLGYTDRIDVVLHTYGGSVTVSHRISKLLRDFAAQVNMLIPYKARSSGTLLCLGADNIVMGPLAELGPLDPSITAMNTQSSREPSTISSEEIKAVRQVAENWFGVHSEDNLTQVFRAVSDRIFPTSLAGFFRAEQLMYSIADELLHYHLPEATTDQRHQIIQQLVCGYHSHDYVITQKEAKRIGLQVSSPSQTEEALLWSIWKKCRNYLNTPVTPSAQTGNTMYVDGLLASTSFVARHVVQWAEYTPITSQVVTASTHRTTMHAVKQGYWEILFKTDSSD